MDNRNEEITNLIAAISSFIDLGLVSSSSSSWVEFVKGRFRDTFQHLTGEDSEQLPTNVERVEHCPILVVS